MASSHAEAPVVPLPPGAWFDARGGLVVVGPGRRLRLELSAPIVACEPAFAEPAEPAALSARASLPFRALGEACRAGYPSILLPEEATTASPSELERAYRDVARCAADDFGATSGWIPAIVAASDPCPAALGPGWRLPQAREFSGLTVDDRKAVAGALFGADERAGLGSLLHYARSDVGEVELVTLSPNAAERAPSLGPSERARPFFGAALRCVREGHAFGHEPPPPPVLPHAKQCLESLRALRASARTPTERASAPRELTELRRWVEALGHDPLRLQQEPALRDLAALLEAPALERLAREASEERELTDRYAQLADALDEPGVSAGERLRRRAEFDNLRRRLSGKLAQNAGGAELYTELDALLTHLERTLRAPPPAPPSKARKGVARTPTLDHRPLVSRVRQLRGESSAPP